MSDVCAYCGQPCGPNEKHTDEDCTAYLKEHPEGGPLFEKLGGKIAPMYPQEPCIICGEEVCMPRYEVTSTFRGGETVGFLCDDCGAKVTSNTHEVRSQEES